MITTDSNSMPQPIDTSTPPTIAGDNRSNRSMAAGSTSAHKHTFTGDNPMKTSRNSLPANSSGYSDHYQTQEVTETICEEFLCRSSFCEYFKLIFVSVFVGILILLVFVGVALHYSVLQLPVPVNFVLLIGAIILLAYLESLHFAVVSVEKWDMTQYRSNYPRAAKLHALVNTPEKVKKFLVGRQFFTLFVVFLIAQITAFEGMPNDFLGLPPLLNLIIIRTGLPGVFLTLTVGQLVS